MEVFYILLHLGSVVLLLIVMGAHPYRTTLSQFELKRRVREKDPQALKIVEREKLLEGVFSLQRVTTALLLVITSFLGVLAYHWAVGLLIALLVALEAGTVAHLPSLQRISQKIYDRFEPVVLRFVEKFPGFLKLIRTVVPPVEDTTLDSREELVYMVEQAGDILNDDEKRLIEGSLAFTDRRVSSVMTPRSMVDSIDKKELLGPLVLDTLHKTGHTRFPVTDGDIDHVVGMLYVQNLLVLDAKQRSKTVEKAMEPRIFYIREDHSLQHALSAFIRTHHHLFIVVNEFRETVGIVSLEDVIEALLGRKITDEFDAHEDLRAVALHSPRGNNTAKEHHNV